MFSERVKELRTGRNLTQVQLAKELSVTKQSVSNWENGNIQPSIDMLMSIAGFFEVSTDYLLGLDDRRMLDVTGLTDEQIGHIANIIADIVG